MGQNLVLNMDDHGYTVCAYNRTTSKVDKFLANEAKGTKVVGAHSVEELCAKYVTSYAVCTEMIPLETVVILLKIVIRVRSLCDVEVFANDGYVSLSFAIGFQYLTLFPFSIMLTIIFLSSHLNVENEPCTM